MRKTNVFAGWLLFLTSVVAFFEGAASLRWPAGRYGLPNTIYGCPNTDGFAWDRGNITQALGPYSKASGSFHLKATVNNKGIQRSFCIKNTDQPIPARPAWPAGRYCIYRKGGACPVGLKDGSLLWNNRFDLSYTKSAGVVPDGLSTSSNTLINFCCAVNGDKNAPIPLPLESPFVLLAFQSASCQAVRGTLHRAEYIYYNTDGSNKLTSPHPYGAGLYSMNITYCYYQACRSNLTALNGTIMSPFYPSNYPNDVDCQWEIKVPAAYAITLDFEDMDIETSDSSLCSKDWLQVSTGNPQIVYSKYCGKRGNLELEMRSNVVVLGFHSDGVASLNKGFRVHYRATKITVPMTTTHQTTVTKTTISTTTSKTMSLTRTPKPTSSTQTANPATEQSTTTTRESSEGQGTSIWTEIPRPSPSATPDVRGSRNKDSGRRVWVIPVVVCLSVLFVTVLLVVLYFKCWKRRNTIRQRHSTVKYNKKGSYVDMEIQRDAVFGNPNADAPTLYDNYPGDNGYSEPKPTEAIQGPTYEEIPDPKCMAKMNDYDTPQRASGTAHVYESATLPPKK